MVRQSLILLFGLVVVGCSLAKAFESGPELIATAIRGKGLYQKYLQWKSEQPEDSDTSFKAFIESTKEAAENRQLAQRQADESEETKTYELGHDDGELQNLYQEWRNIQPEGSSTSFEAYLEWLREQRTLRELEAVDRDPVNGETFEKRGCKYFCTCCPLKCGFSC